MKMILCNENVHNTYTPKGSVPIRPRSWLRACPTVRKLGAELGRNAPCYCGSGRKFKRCCLARIKRLGHQPPRPVAR